MNVRKRRRSKPVGRIILLIGIIGGGIFLLTSPSFERNVPVVTLEGNQEFWNQKSPLVFTIDDDSGLRSSKATLRSGDAVFELGQKWIDGQEHDVRLSVEVPAEITRSLGDEVILEIEAVDLSKWRFFAGNVGRYQFPLTIDRKRPDARIVKNSYGIGKGGSALVVYRVHDEHLQEFYIETKTGLRFQGQPFFKEGYYISLIAWPVPVDDFGATLVARDQAGNVGKAPISLFMKEVQYRTRELDLSEGYLEGKIRQLAEDLPETYGVEDRIEQFKIINEGVRAVNEAEISNSTAAVSGGMIREFSISPMYPLRNAKIVGDFGDHRYYRYEGQPVSESYHLGLDMASVKRAEIIPRNGGTVVFASDNGIYGNMPILDHGMGLHTLYAHCSSMNVEPGETVEAGTVIANTGETGSVLGDHVHFGVLVQGVAVRPQEWMDEQWIRLNITEVIDDAKESISRSEAQGEGGSS